MVSPARRRQAVHYLVRRHKVSQRRACRVVGQHRSTQRYEPQPPDYELRLVRAMNALAERYPRYGYRMIWAMLRADGWQVNRKRIDHSIGASDVIVHLAQLFRIHGKPEIIRSDNGREFIAASVDAWLASQGVRTAFVEKGSPQQNAFIERYNGTMREEVLNGEEFETLLEARVVIGGWREHYNRHRPHRSLGFKSPFQFADEVRKIASRERREGRA